MQFSCQICHTWTVEISGSQTWTSESGHPMLFVTGRCAHCLSLQLIKPTDYAIEAVKKDDWAGRDADERVTASG